MSVFKKRQAAKLLEDQKPTQGSAVVKAKGPSRFGQRIAMRRATQHGETTDSVQTVETKAETSVQDLEYFQLVVDSYVEKMQGMEDIEERKPLKAEAIKTLEPFVADYVTKAALYPNSVAVRMLVWLFDLDDIMAAVPLALHLIKQGVHKTPGSFNSDLPTFVCDQVYDWANTQLKANKPAGPYLHNVVQSMLDDGWDMHEAVRGKMLAIMGKHFELAGQDEDAIKNYEQALRENEAAGVKTRLDKLKKLHGVE